MYIIAYAFNRIKRDFKGCIALTLLSFSLVLFICILDDTIAKKELQLKEVYKNLDVECVVSNLRGTQTDNLNIPHYILTLFLSDETIYQGIKDPLPFSLYIKNLELKLSLKYEYLDEDEKVFIMNMSLADDLVGLTHTSADNSIAQESSTTITYFNNYNKSLFLSDEAVCIVSTDVYQTLSKDDEGNCFVRLAVGDFTARDEIFAEQRLKVVGTYTGDSRTIYCPWEIIEELSIKITGVTHTDSLRFSIKDNHQIDNIKTLLTRYFTNVDNSGALKEHLGSNILTHYEYAITVYDGTLNKTASILKDNIRVLEILRPIIIIISFLIGFVASFLFVRNRKPEFAVMRSLGTKKRMVFGEVFIEQFSLGIIGTTLGLMVYYVLYNFKIMPPWNNIAILLLCYMLGCSIVMFWIVNVKVMSILKEKE